MAQSLIHDEEYVVASSAQTAAADPRHTRLVSANAGSGKTRVLVNRVSRILLAGTLPEKILCLTYTKAAAAEMQSRLFQTLGKWSIMEESALNEALRELLGDEAELPPLGEARTLFAKALETPDGLKVQTIHAFCERILARFPIEAGILPGFEPIDDIDMREIRAQTRKSILQKAALEPSSEINHAVQYLAGRKADQTLDELFAWMAQSGPKITDWVQSGGVLDLAALFDLPENGLPVSDIKAQAWEAAPKAQLRAAMKGMLDSPKEKDRKHGELISRALADTDPERAYDFYAQAILKADNTPNSQIVTKDAGSDAKALFGAYRKTDTPENDRMRAVGERFKAAACLRGTRAVLTVAKAYQEEFTHIKRARRGLDFGDQISLVNALLMRSEVSDWIAYKLDGGVEHILVDEAQDTAPQQWQIIDALAEPFFQDNPDRKNPRTLFAVGDEKQSIYSFQGAKPEQFIEKIQSYERKAGRGEIRMRMSFRSTPEILQFVDQIFVEDKYMQRMFDAEKYLTASDLNGHTAFFKHAKGQIEVWPLAPRPEKPDVSEAWDTRPVDAVNATDSRETLAVEVAARISSALKNGETIYDKDMDDYRPVEAGDILILVRQRNVFFEAIIRNLKKLGLPVAGADRLKLNQSLAVKDLLALARFVLLPADDLSLAEVLKSPLLGCDEAELYNLAQGRSGISLWQSVKDKRADLAEILQTIIGYSRRYAPYEFFARVLEMKAPSGESLLRRIYGRLGLEAKDAIEAFLGKALSYQRREAPSLQYFVQSFVKDEQVLKREMDEARGKIRVMTVHGAKGLEAPMVILPDTTQLPSKTSQMTPFNDGFVLTGNKKTAPEAIRPYVEAKTRRVQEEYFRLLYVAITRAQSRLIVCGYAHGKVSEGYSQDSWYELCQNAVKALSTEELETPFGEGMSFGQGRPALRAVGGSVKPDTSESGPEFKSAHYLSDFLSRPAQIESAPYRRVTPSHLLTTDQNYNPPIRSPLKTGYADRFGRGNLIHKLLELLPDIEISRRPDIARIFLEQNNVAPEMASEITREVFAVLDHPDFEIFFQEGSYAEVSLAGQAKTLPKGLYLNGQIDRLSVSDDIVYIIDYKSNRPPPREQTSVPPIYMAQMAAYRELAREIYPDHKIVCALLWTDGPFLMVLDAEHLDQALTQVRAQLT